MCGIAGLFDLSGKNIDGKLLHRMDTALSHRGPDGHGEYINKNVGLSNRRLAIIDPRPEGNQPLASADGNLVITFNGEIFNYSNLRNDLEKLGYTFKTKTDTETILLAYRHFGKSCVEKLRGQFAFCIYDKKRQELFLARDQIGVNPLYYTLVGKTFFFASELKGILASTLVKKEINIEALHHFLSMFVIPQPLTIIKGVYSLLPGHFMKVTQKGISIQKYYSLPVGNVEYSHLSFDNLKNELKNKLISAVERAKVADVPIGAFLSGGIDSSLVVSLLAKTTKKLKTYSIYTEGESYFDERKYAQKVSQMYSTNHHEYTVTQPELVKEFPQIVYFFDQPTGGSLETYFVSKYASRDVKVALSGLGGDELFSGYHTNVLNTLKFAGFYRKIPTKIRQTLIDVLKAIPLENRMKKTITIADSFLSLPTPLSRLLFLYFTFSEREKDKLYSANFKKEARKYNTENYFSQIEREIPTKNPVDLFSYIDLNSYTRDDLLTGMNMSSMSHSLESRVPLLDVDLLDFASRIPPKYKYLNGQGKYILKETAREYLPNEIIDRKKVGFAIPRINYMKDMLYPHIQNVLRPESIKKRGLFRSKYVNKIVSDFYNQSKGRMLWSEHLRVWSLFVFELWCRLYIDSKEIRKPTSSLEELCA